MSQIAYIGIGTNMGDKVRNCIRALQAMGRLPGCAIQAKSDFFRTEPVGVLNQEWYVNAVVSLQTRLSPEGLLQKLLAIEKELGRVRLERWGPRIVDLDILLFGDLVLQETTLVIPHPRMHLRRFVLEPLVELAPGLIHPILGKTMTELLRNCPREGQSVMRMGRTPS